MEAKATSQLLLHQLLNSCGELSNELLERIIYDVLAISPSSQRAKVSEEEREQNKKIMIRRLGRDTTDIGIERFVAAVDTSVLANLSPEVEANFDNLAAVVEDEMKATGPFTFLQAAGKDVLREAHEQFVGEFEKSPIVEEGRQLRVEIVEELFLSGWEGLLSLLSESVLKDMAKEWKVDVGDTVDWLSNPDIVAPETEMSDHQLLVEQLVLRGYNLTEIFAVPAGTVPHAGSGIGFVTGELADAKQAAPAQLHPSGTAGYCEGTTKSPEHPQRRLSLSAARRTSRRRSEVATRKSQRRGSAALDSILPAHLNGADTRRQSLSINFLKRQKHTVSKAPVAAVSAVDEENSPENGAVVANESTREEAHMETRIRGETAPPEKPVEEPTNEPDQQQEEEDQKQEHIEKEEKEEEEEEEEVAVAEEQENTDQEGEKQETPTDQDTGKEEQEEQEEEKEKVEKEQEDEKEGENAGKHQEETHFDLKILKLLNSADTEELIQLHTIGKKRAQIIVSKRGEGYSSVEDLKLRKVLSEKQFATFMKRNEEDYPF